MANAAQKKLAATNAQTLRTHRYAFFLINSTFILIRLILRYKSSSMSLYILYFLSFSLAAFLQYQLESVGRPKFDERGGVLQTGSDLGQQGLTEYMFDVLYLTWGIQLLVAISTIHAFWLYILIPGYAGLKIWGLYKGRSGLVAEQQQGQPASEKQTRAQKRGSRK